MPTLFPQLTHAQKLSTSHTENGVSFPACQLASFGGDVVPSVAVDQISLELWIACWCTVDDEVRGTAANDLATRIL